MPGDAKTAEHGEWVKGPGAALFEALRDALGELPIVAENLGVITPEVEALRQRFGFPGMAILQFAFGSDPQGSTFIPHNFERELVAYTGTHDNDTTVGWWTGGVGDSTRSEADVEAERAYALEYLKSDGREIHWDFIRALIASVADLAIVPAAGRPRPRQRGADEPARPAGRQLAVALRARRAHPGDHRALRKLTDIYGRAQ